MYSYKLVNNHIIVDIEGKNYVLDTGFPFSFSFIGDNYVEIDERKVRLAPKPVQFNNAKTFECIGMAVDGLLGLDSFVAVTIYKNGIIDFKANDIDGDVIHMIRDFPLAINVSFGSVQGRLAIDTGAKYGYGRKEIFDVDPFDRVNDYNPYIGELRSDIYHLTVTINGKQKPIDVCYNPKPYHMMSQSIVCIASITSLFDEACVIDIERSRLILK